VFIQLFSLKSNDLISPVKDDLRLVAVVVRCFQDTTGAGAKFLNNGRKFLNRRNAMQGGKYA
jgi:hypothetical protein